MSFVISRLGVFFGSVLRTPDFRDLDTPLSVAEESVDAWEAGDLTPIRPASGAGSGAEEVSTQATPHAVPPVPSSALPERRHLFDVICEVLDATQVSLWLNGAEPLPYGRIHPEDVGRLAAEICDRFDPPAKRMEAAHERVAEKLKRLK